MTQLAALPRGEAITHDRRETKYLVSPARAPRFVRALAARLPQHRFTGDGANHLPHPHHYVTSVYFDTEAHDHLRAARADAEHNLKVRAREYYDLHPSLAELATDPTQIVRYQPFVWLELKRRHEGRSQKLRVRLDKRALPAFLRGELPADLPAGDDGSAILGYCRALSSPLVPSCIVSYRRLSFQEAHGAVRITVDLDVGFYAAPADLWTRTYALVRGTFGRPVEVEPSVLVEVKLGAEPPPWLADVLREGRATVVSYSKFARAAGAVHGPR